MDTVFKTELDAESSEASLSSPLKRKAERPRTVPEQIADHLGMAILQGEYRGGERIREQELAERYGVSRGPVREAIRALEKRGLVEFFPRRGAYAVSVSLDLVADLFNIRASLFGLAARCFTRVASEAGLAELQRRVLQLRSSAMAPEVDPTACAFENSRVAAVLYRYCRSEYLARLLRDQANESLWGLIWRQRPLDFLTVERRQQAADDWSALERAARDGDEATAEYLARKALFASRDSALAVLGALRQERVDPTKLIGQ